MRGEGTFAIADMTKSPGYLAGDNLARKIVDLAGRAQSRDRAAMR